MSDDRCLQTLHGPTSDKYDEAKLPILLTDWGESIFDVFTLLTFALFIVALITVLPL